MKAASVSSLNGVGRLAAPSPSPVVEAAPLSTPAASLRGLSIGMVLLLVAAALTAAPAQAHQTHFLTKTFDSYNAVRGAAADASPTGNGDVYMVDAVGSPQRVLKYDPAGNPEPFTAVAPYISANAITGIPGHTWEDAAGDNAFWAAVDPANGNLYVSDLPADYVAEFESNGTFIRKITGAETPQGSFIPGGLAVDPVNGNLYVGDRGADKIDTFDSSGHYVSQFSAGSAELLVQLASDSKGDVYATDQLHKLTRFTPAGAPDPFPATGSAVLDTNEPFAVAVDPENNQIYVFENSTGSVAEFDPEGNLLGRFGGGEVGFSVGLAVGTNHDLYYADAGNNDAAIFGAGVVVPDATTGAATDIAPDSATLNGTIDAGGGGDASCQFQYVTDSQFGVDAYAGASTAPCSTDPVTGSGPLAETTSPDPLTGLAPETTYHFRILATNANGTTNGSDQTFTTRQAVQLATGGASDVTPGAATLHGTVNPQGNALSDCHFDYGTDTSYGSGSLPCLRDDNNGTDLGSGSTDLGVHADVSGLSPVTDYHFRLSAANGFGTTNGSDQAFTTPPAVQLATGQASEVLDTTATVGGTLNPQGNAISDCHFDYADDASVQPYLGGPFEDLAFGFYGHTAPCATIPTGSGPVSVSADLSGLSAHTAYDFRLSATNGYGTTNGSVQGFTTLFLLIPPQVDSTSAAHVTSTSADLQAQVNPNHYDTAYHFEYVEDATYQADQGSGDGFQHAARAPSSSEVGLGSGGAGVTASQQIQGLQPATTYHYRVLAANGNGGPQAGPAHAFTTQEASPSLGLPDHRAYEMVSPVDKNGGNISGIDGISGAGIVEAATDGNSVTYDSQAAFAGAQSASVGSQYLSTRTAAGWTTRSLGFPIASQSYPFVGTGPPWYDFSPDLSRALVSNGLGGGGGEGNGQAVPNPPLPGTGAPAGFRNYYLHDAGTGSYQALLTATNATPVDPPETFQFNYLGATPDLSHTVIQARPISPEAIGGNPNSPDNLYEWTSSPAGGHFELISIDSAGNPTVMDGLARDNGGSPFNAISNDGSKVFMRGSGGLFLREGIGTPQTTTVRIDASQGPDPSDRGNHWMMASADGSLAFFTSELLLTNDATTGSRGCSPGCGRPGSDLYRYDAASGQLTDLTVDPTDPAGADVVGVLGAGEDGSYLYFAANGVLTDTPNAQGESASPGNCSRNNAFGSCSLYLWHNGTIAFISRLSGQDGDSSGGEGFGLSFDWTGMMADQTTRVTPDGKYLVFMSSANLTGNDSAGDEEVFLYDARSGQLTCVSCNPTGALPVGPSGIDGGTGWAGGTYGGKANYQSHQLSTDGSRVFFESADALLPQDTNGKIDVYEWERQGAGTCQRAPGCLYLISAGTSPSDSRFVDASPNGDDVFFLTASSLVPQDPGSVDLYDARSGGGFPPPPPPPPACQGDACQSPATPPNDATPGSLTYHGPGNPSAKSAKPRHRRPRHHHHRRHTARPAGHKRGGSQ